MTVIAVGRGTDGTCDALRDLNATDGGIVLEPGHYDLISVSTIARENPSVAYQGDDCWCHDSELDSYFPKHGVFCAFLWINPSIIHDQLKVLSGHFKTFFHRKCFMQLKCFVNFRF